MADVSCAALQRDFDRQERGAEKKLKFSTVQFRVLHVGRNNPEHWQTLGFDFMGRTWVSWWTTSCP